MMTHRPFEFGNPLVFLALRDAFEAWDRRERRSLGERMTKLRHAHGMSVFLLCVMVAALVANVGLIVGLALGQSYVLGGMAALVMWSWARRFISRRQSKTWCRLLQTSMGRLTAFIVGGLLTSLALAPFDETFLTQVAGLIGGIIFAFGPLKASAQNANHAG